MSKHLTAWKNEATGETHSPKGRLLYPALLEAKKNRNFPEQPPKFSAGLLIPAAANIDVIKEDIARIGLAEHGKDWKTKKLHICLKKTIDNPKLAEFAEAFPLFLSATANQDFPPFVFGPDAKPFNGDFSDIYMGRWAVIAGNAWGSKKGVGNIGWNLNRIQLLDHDEPIAGGRVATADGFEAVSSPTTGGGEKAEGAGTADSLWA